MRLPLYKMTAPEREKDGNAGLWYDKFCNQWQRDWSGLGDSGKREWIATLAPADGSARIGNGAELARRQRSLVDAAGGICDEFITQGPFASGLGREHPVENGFAWHHTLGTPFLPGTSVKGMVRAWAKTWEQAEEQDLSRIFGPEPLAQEAGVGSVVFLDALPTGPVILKAEIMTPHYGPYYQNGDIPGDWHSPTPIPYLAVASQQRFLFALMPRTPADREDCARAFEWLSAALQFAGAGAKTATGFGRFTVDPEAKARNAKQAKELEAQKQAEAAQQARERELGGLSPLAREFKELDAARHWTVDRGAFGQLIAAILEKLEADPVPDALKLIEDAARSLYPDLMANPDALTGNGEPKFKATQREWAKRLLKLLNRNE